MMKNKKWYVNTQNARHVYCDKPRWNKTDDLISCLKFDVWLFLVYLTSHIAARKIVELGDPENMRVAIWILFLRSQELEVA